MVLCSEKLQNWKQVAHVCNAKKEIHLRNKNPKVTATFIVKGW